MIAGNGSGSDGAGVELRGSGNSVLGNFIGTDPSGSTALGNVPFGVLLDGGSQQVGGTGDGEGNVISGNQVGIFFSGATGAVIAGNLIGTDVSGTLAIPNSGPGIDANLPLSTTIGGDTPEARNVISGNGGAGIDVDGGVTRMLPLTVNHNFIGTDREGGAPLPNGGPGISLNLANAVVGGPNPATATSSRSTRAPGSGSSRTTAAGRCAATPWSPTAPSASTSASPG